MRTTLTFGRPAAIRANATTLLHVPAMHRDTPPAIRVEVFELVLRRLYGEACDLAAATTDDIEYRATSRRRLAALMAQTPHRNTRGLAAAA